MNGKRERKKLFEVFKSDRLINSESSNRSTVALLIHPKSLAASTVAAAVGIIISLAAEVAIRSTTVRILLNKTFFFAHTC